jgi:hypothetical protein
MVAQGQDGLYPLSGIRQRYRILREPPKEIAYVLGLRINTVEWHRIRLMRKLDMHDTASFMRYAIRPGLTSLRAGPSFRVSPHPPSGVFLPSSPGFTR